MGEDIHRILNLPVKGIPKILWYLVLLSCHQTDCPRSVRTLKGGKRDNSMKKNDKKNNGIAVKALNFKNPLYIPIKKNTDETSYGKSSGKYDTTADFLTNIENRNGKFYTDKATIDKIGQVEARGEDFSLLNKRIMSSRASTEGGTSVVYKYSDELGTKYLIHEVTDARGYIIHRDFDAVRISSGQLINKGH